MKIGLDFDRVLVNYPPFVPEFLIELLYKKKGNQLTYRFPGKLEQKIRVVSHFPILRPPIKNNIDCLKILSGKHTSLFLVSSRFSFLKKRTEAWSKRSGISKYFKKIYFNYEDEQPHLFKEKIIKKQKIKKFIDDDLDLLKYLSKKAPNTNFYWLSKSKKKRELPKNIIQINNLEEFLKYV